jgi:hypothetical protein
LGIATAAQITSTVAAINALKPPEIGLLILYAFTIASADQMVGLHPSSLSDLTTLSDLMITGSQPVSCDNPCMVRALHKDTTSR